MATSAKIKSTSLTTFTGIRTVLGLGRHGLQERPPNNTKNQRPGIPPGRVSVVTNREIGHVTGPHAGLLNLKASPRLLPFGPAAPRTRRIRSTSSLHLIYARPRHQEPCSLLPTGRLVTPLDRRWPPVSLVQIGGSLWIVDATDEVRVSNYLLTGFAGLTQPAGGPHELLTLPTTTRVTPGFSDPPPSPASDG